MARTAQQHEEQMLRASELYYYEGQTQAAVAEALGCTRWTVGRLLEDARNVGIVRITIDHPRARRHELELQLRERFGLRDAVVVPSQANTAATAKSVCSAAARHLAATRPAVHHIAVSWGRTIAGVAAEMPDAWSHGVEVVQANGGPALARGNPVGDSLYTLAERGSGTVRHLPGPTIVDSLELADLLRKDASISTTLRLAEACRVMLYSPGSVDADSVLVQSGYVSPEQVEAAQAHGVVGDVMSHFVDATGTPVLAELDRRTLSIDLDAVRRCPHVIAVASGTHKIAATRAAVSAGLCTTLITDGAVATALLNEPDPPASVRPQHPADA